MWLVAGALVEPAGRTRVAEAGMALSIVDAPALRGIVEEFRRVQARESGVALCNPPFVFYPTMEAYLVDHAGKHCGANPGGCPRVRSTAPREEKGRDGNARQADARRSWRAFWRHELLHEPDVHLETLGGRMVRLAVNDPVVGR